MQKEEDLRDFGYQNWNDRLTSDGIGFAFLSCFLVGQQQVGQSISLVLSLVDMVQL